MKYMLRLVAAVLLLFPVLAFAGGAPEESGTESIVLTLDWVPNTNHIGAYVAQAMGYFSEEGLEVEIVQPAEASAEALVAAGRADYGYSYQESVTFARTGEDSLPVVAIAAVIQHNTSGFASPAELGITTVADLAGMRYGGWGSPVEIAMIETLMEAAGFSLDDVEIFNTGTADFFAVTDRDVDFSWVYEGWTMVEAEIRGVDLNYLDLADIDPVFDYYTPVLITSEDKISANPAQVAAFTRAMSRGYEYAVMHPAEAAEILVAAVPELDADLVARSLEFLADEFIAEAPRWGEMDVAVWSRYAGWLYDNGLISRELEVEGSFTNDFLP